MPLARIISLGTRSIGRLESLGGLSPYAFGGVVTQDSEFYYHTFTGTGTFRLKTNLPHGSNVTALLVAGGGGGSYAAQLGGGGGAGGVRLLHGIGVARGTAHVVEVGAGGAHASGAETNGGNTIFYGTTTYTVQGGGKGSTSAGSIGGSGGGGGQNGSTLGGGSIYGEGNNGGNGQSGSGSSQNGGGGGGAYTAGSTGTSSSIGGNGIRVYCNDTNTLTYYGGGGGGARYSTGSPAANVAGGLGGGGYGATYGFGNPAPRSGPPYDGSAGLTNTGGGGGARTVDGAGNGGIGGAGGSGIAIVFYPKSQYNSNFDGARVKYKNVHDSPVRYSVWYSNDYSNWTSLGNSSNMLNGISNADTAWEAQGRKRYWRIELIDPNDGIINAADQILGIEWRRNGTYITNKWTNSVIVQGFAGASFTSPTFGNSTSSSYLTQTFSNLYELENSFQDESRSFVINSGARSFRVDFDFGA